MSVYDVGGRVARWAAPFQFVTLSAGAGVCLIASRGGETRWYVHTMEAGASVHGVDVGFMVTSSQRSGDTQSFELLAPSLDDVERFLLGVIGPAVRSAVLPSVPRLAPLVRIEDLAAPFTYVRAPDDSGRGDLFEDGLFRARFSSFTSAHTAVRFSQYANTPVPTIAAAFLDPAGTPVFALHPTELSA
jgi:hypothetical protein